MAVEDTWVRKDGTPSARAGRGLQYRVRWRGKAKSFRTKKAAENYWIKLRSEAPAAKTQAVLVDVLLDRWLATKQSLSPRGLTACEGALRHVRPVWGHRLASGIKPVEIDIWLAGLTYSPSMKHKLLQCLSGALRIGVELDLISTNPATKVKTAREINREANFLTPVELRALADATGHYSSLIQFLATTGARIGEAAALNIGDVDKDRGRVRIRKSKNGEARDLPVPAKVLAQLDLSRDRTAPLFTTERGNRVLVDNWRARRFDPAAEAVDLGYIVPHDLRHTAASLAIASGADVKAVQKMLGHKTATLTLDRYGHLWDKGLDDVSARMDGLL